ncbi:DEAD/DEAH box helicase [Alcanivorax sp. 1008]|uniref:DEAD/DEAH box helicase n=1 Tax=Alcanivorax sp. 1008 TaxID=2816853 RepID=UPI001E15D140|nr:DEAD/DEAH box helicase [Alcanivorax sp. 1008]MCC1498289.1 DEAD/DEAH box helicase [Alcanivorax sp. 1008]
MLPLTDFASLPEGLESLRGLLPSEVSISERIIDPIVVVSRARGRIVARLAGVKMFRGRRILCFAPSNRHAWVLDGNLVRPLPRDVVAVVFGLLRGLDPENLSYGDALSLINRSDSEVVFEADDDFFRPGSVSAEVFPDEIYIPGLSATLYPYQARGIAWMRETISQTGGLILADEMGLGKTIQIISLLLLDSPSDESPALILCPTSLIANWVREFSRFACDMTLMVHRGSERAGIYRDLMKAQVVITTYDTMVNDLSIFSSIEWSWVICDEAQAIKNPDSNRRCAIMNIPRRRAIPMTGTPVENGLLDLWSLADFAIPGLLGSRHEFQQKYPDDLDSAQALSKITDPIILKRRVADVAGDLPDRIDVDVPLDLDDVLVEHYLNVRNETLAKYPVAGALVATLQLQLFCAHPWLRCMDIDGAGIEDADIHRIGSRPLVTAKIERAVDLVRESFSNNRKVIVFSIFNRVGDLLREAFGGLSNAYWGSINGSTPQQDRQEIIDTFSDHGGPACMVLNPKAAGAGLNITAATVVIHFTPVWNPALEAQASARAHRRGQTDVVTIYRLFYKDTIEEVMVARSQWKSELADESMSFSSRDSDDIRKALDKIPRKS